jgi:hypothetical protein
MKILVLVDSININDSSGSKANVAMIANLVEAGFEVKVFHYTQKEIQLPGVKCISIPEKKWNVHYLLSRLQRIFTRYTGIHLHTFLENSFGFSFTFFNDTHSIVTFLKKETNFKPNLVITLSKAASFRPHFALLKLPQWHTKWLAYVHDPYPFHYYPQPYTWYEPGYKQKEQFFKEVSEKAKFAAFPSLFLKEWMGTNFPNFLKTGVIIPHQNAPQDFEISQENLKFPPYFDDTKFNLLHAGNLLKQRSPEGLIKGFKLFLHQNPEAKNEARLLLLGPASYHLKMLENYQNNSPEIFIYNDNIAFDVVYQLQQAVSVNIILEAKAELSPFLPAKFPHCIAANKAILLLAPVQSETKRLLGNEYPYWSAVDEVSKIASIIENLYQLWKENPNQLLLNRNDLEDYLSSDYLKKVIENLENNA